MNPALIVIGSAFVVLGLLGAMGRVPYRSWLGLRLESVVRTPEGWRRAHRAAAPWQLLAGSAFVTAGVRSGTSDDAALFVVGSAAMAAGFLMAHRAAVRRNPG